MGPQAVRRKGLGKGVGGCTLLATQHVIAKGSLVEGSLRRS